MNYASDPYWAHKKYMEPEARQAYENQVMTDRAAQSRHRTEGDLLAIAAGGIALGVWMSGRSERKASKALSRYIRDHCPRDYVARKEAFTGAVDKLGSAHASAVTSLEADIAAQERRLTYGGTAKSIKATRSRLEALKARLADKNLAYSTDLDSLLLRYSDIVEYEAGLATLV